MLQEVEAVRTIAQRGVLMVGTAHGTDIHSLMKNPELCPLLGGIHSVMLGDAEAKRLNSGSKTRLERAGAPAFSTLLEVVSPSCWLLHPDVAESVDILLGAEGAGPGGAQLRPHSQVRRYEASYLLGGPLRRQQQ